MFALAEDLSLLCDLAEGRIPASGNRSRWTACRKQSSSRPLTWSVPAAAPSSSSTSTTSGRSTSRWSNAAGLLHPAHPLGHRLVGRFDGKLDRPANTLRILGFWLEDPATGKDPDFAAALGRGMARYLRFLGAARLDAAAIRPVALRKAVVRRPGEWK